MFGRGLRLNYGCDEIGINAHYAPETLAPMEIVNRNARRCASRAAVTGWPVSNVLAATKTTLRKLAIQNARVIANKMRKHLAFLLPGKIGAGAGSRNEKLREIPLLDGHGKIICF